MRYLGVHVSTAGGVDKAFNHIKALEINAAQIFLKNSNQWAALPYKPEIVDNFKKLWKEKPEIKIFAHTGYLINLAGEGETLEKSIAALADEIQRADQLGVNYLVLHPGSHKGAGETVGIKQIAAMLDKIFKENENDVSVLLETTAGQGNSVGYRFEHLRDIIDLSSNKKRLAVCLDTCHAYSAGYDLATVDGYEESISSFDKIIGLNQLKLIHLNDSKNPYQSKKDRHEHIGAGTLGLAGFKPLLTDKRIFDVPLILETPKSDDYTDDLKNLAQVKEIWSDR